MGQFTDEMMPIAAMRTLDSLAAVTSSCAPTTDAQLMANADLPTHMDTLGMHDDAGQHQRHPHDSYHHHHHQLQPLRPQMHPPSSSSMCNADAVRRRKSLRKRCVFY